jgi:hypothetical protein
MPYKSKDALVVHGASGFPGYILRLEAAGSIPGRHQRHRTGVVQQADGGAVVVGHEAAPIPRTAVAGDAQAAAFVGGGDEAEQPLAAGAVQRREADFVEMISSCRSRVSMTFPTLLSARPR